MTLADTIESCAQDHGLSPRTAALIAERVTDRLTEEAGQGDVVAAAVLRCSTEEAVRAAEEERAELLRALIAAEAKMFALGREFSGPRFTDRYGDGPDLLRLADLARAAIARARGTAAEAHGHGG